MKKGIRLLLAVVINIFIVESVFAGYIIDETFNDDYIGPEYTSPQYPVTPDSIGDEYKMDGMKVTLDDQNVLQVTLLAGDTNYFSEWKKDNVTYGPGSFFLGVDTEWKWDYAITLDNILTENPATPGARYESGTADLYNIAADGGTIHGGIERVNEPAVYYDPKGSPLSSSGSWQYDDTGALTKLVISMTLPQSFMDAFRASGSLTFQWSQFCANDIVRAQVRLPAPSPVPEPATMALLGAGLLGVGFVRRRKRK